MVRIFTESDTQLAIHCFKCKERQKCDINVKVGPGGGLAPGWPLELDSLVANKECPLLSTRDVALV